MDAGAQPYLCGACRRSPRPFSRLVFHAPYEGALRELITDFKFRARLGGTALLGELAAKAFVRSGIQVPDFVVPVPLHRRRLRRRGFNQSVELGRSIARFLRVPCAVQGVRRIRETAPQAGLPHRERSSNVKKAFAAEAAFAAGKRILLVDDVMTTGGTLDECAKVVKKAGAADVFALVVARTPKK